MKTFRKIKKNIWDKRFLWLAITLFIVSVSTLIYYFNNVSLEEIQYFIQGFGAIAPLVFILVCIVKPVLFFLPSAGLTIIAGLLFGPYWGTLCIVAGGAGSSAFAFHLARRVGRERIKRFIKNKNRLLNIDMKMKNNGFKTVFMLRLFNVPWDIVSYSAGLSGIRFKDFYLGTLVLLPPISFVYTYFGSSVGNPLSAKFAISLGVIIVLGGIPFLIRRVKNAKKEEDRSRTTSD